MYKTVLEIELPGLIETWMKQATVYAPAGQGGMSAFQPLADPFQVDMNYMNDRINTRYPAKALFLPQSEVMFGVRQGQFFSTEDTVKPRVIFGMRPCDIRAIKLLDAVFLTGSSPDPYWARKRELTTIVGLGCHVPGPECFCTSVGTGPFDSCGDRGADAMLTMVDNRHTDIQHTDIQRTDNRHTENGHMCNNHMGNNHMGNNHLDNNHIGNNYYGVEIYTPKGQVLFGGLGDATDSQREAMRQIQLSAAAKVQKPFTTEGIKDRLNALFASDFWDRVQQSCLGCGVCTYLCPTCHCFDIVDETKSYERVRNWDSCMFRIYSQEASGYNPRPRVKERIRQRIMHKFVYFSERLQGRVTDSCHSSNEIGCVGCGRCVRFCPVNLDIRAIIRLAQEEYPF